MKRNRSPTSKYAAFRSLFEFRSFFDRAPFILRSSSVMALFEFRSSFVRASFGNRRTLGDVSTIQRSRHEETANHEIETNKTEA